LSDVAQILATGFFVIIICTGVIIGAGQVPLFAKHVVFPFAWFRMIVAVAKSLKTARNTTVSIAYVG